MKAVCPYGILILGHRDVPNKNMEFAANIMANLIDIKGNGLPIDDKIYN